LCGAWPHPVYELAPLPTKEATLEVGRVPPFPTEETFVFRIALLKKGSGETIATVVFVTIGGDHLEKPLELELP
jgi:hypothetical protein